MATVQVYYAHEIKKIIALRLWTFLRRLYFSPKCLHQSVQPVTSHLKNVIVRDDENNYQQTHVMVPS
jgi:hypothetical protein